MKHLFATFSMVLLGLLVKGQCNFVDISVSSSSADRVQLYTPAFFLIPDGSFNQNHWIVKNEAGTTIHEETTSGAWADQSFSVFNHTTPLAETMEVCLTVTNTSTGEICGLCNTLSWIDNITNWTFTETVGGTTLPVELTVFKAKVNRQSIDLEWTTESERNNRGFYVEKSKDGRMWQSIGWVEGKGTSTEVNRYHSTDKRPLSGLNYYRLKQMDKDDTFTYSNIVQVEFIKEETDIAIYPNPSKGHVQIDVDIPNREDTKVLIYNSIGRLVWSSGLIEDSSSWSKNIYLENNGLYYATISIGDTIAVKPLIIQNVN